MVMLETLLVKRLESSWCSFQSTLKKVHEVHKKTLTAVTNYKDRSELMNIGGITMDESLLSGSEELDEMGFDLDYALGKREIKLSDIAENGKLAVFENHLKSDVKALKKLLDNMEILAQQIEEERAQEKTDSRDKKLAELMQLIHEKQATSTNHKNQKVVIFTAFKDTASYLYRQLHARGFERLGLVSGDGCETWDDTKTHKDFEPLLKRFAPFTKLYMENEWKEFDEPIEGGEWARYLKWRKWVSTERADIKHQLDNPIDILITTDCLSEGQNLQDCDFLVNYDIHWNPVRIVQRLGRIDRLGSPNSEVFGVDFWATADMDEYLGLQDKVAKKVVAMAVSGAEVPNLTQQVEEMLDDVVFEQSQELKLIKQMEMTWEKLEENDQSLKFSDLSLELFRQDLITEIESRNKEYADIPLGVYTGFKGVLSGACDGMVALLGYPARKGGKAAAYTRHNLVYLGQNGAVQSDKPDEILNLLSAHKDEDRFVPTEIDEGDSKKLGQMGESLKRWLGSQTEAGGQAQQQLLDGLMAGDAQALQKAGTHHSLEEEYDPENCDLILWFVVSEKG